MVSLIHARVNDYLIETTMTVVVAYGTYLLAEWLGVSGVIAVVVAALVLGNYGRAVAMSPSTRLAVSSTWDFFGFLANSLIFLLIGLELNIERLNQYWVPTVMAIVAVLVVRVLVVVFSGAVLRYIHKPIPFSWQSVLVWGGLRGAVALAMALSLPFGIAPSSPFPNRDLLQVMTFGVILFSLLVQGLTIEPLLRRLGLIRVSDWQQEYETLRVRRGMAVAALSEIERWSKSGSLAPDVAEELRRNYSEELGRLDTDMQDLHIRDEDLRQAQLRAARRRLVQLEKTVVQQRYLDGTISEEVRRKLVEDLDSQMHDLESDYVPEEQVQAEDGTEENEEVASTASAGDIEQPRA
jgi:CPA1 family monovalent cation:H+ antiporter